MRLVRVYFITTFSCIKIVALMCLFRVYFIKTFSCIKIFALIRLFHVYFMNTSKLGPGKLEPLLR